MELLLDTIDLDEIKHYMHLTEIAGLTSTPSIIQREAGRPIDFFAHMKQEQALLGPKRKLHLQLPSRQEDALVEDAHKVWNQLGPQVYTKIPTTEAGLAAIKRLKAENPACHITGTAVYTKIQAFLAIQAKADYIAVYTNRSINVDVDPMAIIRAARTFVDQSQGQTKIMASSVKNLGQVTDAFENGADAVTVGPSVLANAFDVAAVKQAVDRFTDDWIALYHHENI